MYVIGALELAAHASNNGILAQANETDGSQFFDNLNMMPRYR
jgi:hypothetical protein